MTADPAHDITVSNPPGQPTHRCPGSTDEAPAQDTPWSLYSEGQRWGFLAILFLVSTSNYLDRNIIGVLLEPIRKEFDLSDTALGLLGGLAFALLYATLGLPVARWADRGNRRTIITLALAVWSIMTVACGMAQNFVQLLLARVGVGAGEAGAIPPAQSLIADYFPPRRRAMALALFTVAATAGYLLGISGGGYLAATYDWRTAFVVVGVPGLLLAVLTAVCLAEPRLKLGFAAAGARESLRDAARILWSKRSYRYAVAGCCLYFFMSYGALVFMPSYLVRVLQVPLEVVSVQYGGAVAVGSILGTLSGGWLADRLARRDLRWQAWLPAIACTLAGPLYILGFELGSFRAMIVISVVCSMLLTGGLPPVFAAIHSVCGNRRRATAIAIVFFAASLCGNGLGPLVAGALSDALSERYGPQSLRYSLEWLMGVLVLTGGAFHRFGRAMPSDLEP